MKNTLNPEQIKLEEKMFLESEARLDAIGRFKDPSEFPWRRDRNGNPIGRKPKASCNLCERPVYDNVNPEKIITCGLCVQILLMASRESKIEYRNTLISEGLTEQARSVESFIIPEDKAVDATFKTSRLQRHSKGYVRGFKRLGMAVKNSI
jgi:hypothetical protein